MVQCAKHESCDKFIAAGMCYYLVDVSRAGSRDGHDVRVVVDRLRGLDGLGVGHLLNPSIHLATAAARGGCLYPTGMRRRGTTLERRGEILLHVLINLVFFW